MAEKDKKVVVLIPFYKEKLDYNSWFSINQCFKILKDYAIVAIKPLRLNISEIMEGFQFNDVVSFDDKYFESIEGYNELMLSTHFYERFTAYEYMLIYQQDAFVFADDLQYWCNQGYDYIGAPWLYPTSKGITLGNFSTYIKSYFYRRYNKLKNNLPVAKQLHNQVGNGGLSLRRIEKFREVLIENQALAASYNARPELEFNEDIFFSIAINRKKRSLKVPSYKKALSFAIETEPQMAIELNKNQLPFGCHAWDKNMGFWLPFLQRHGYDIEEEGK